MKDYARIAHPLLRLLRDGKNYNFDESCKQAFYELKERLTKPAVLALYNSQNETELHTDASKVGFGAVLLQRQVDGKFHPVFFFSKATTASESRMHSFELETLAIIYALQRFDIYLRGIPFKIVTDCNALALTLNKKDISPKIAQKICV